MATANPATPGKLAQLAGNPQYSQVRSNLEEMRAALGKVRSRLAEISILLQQSAADTQPPGVADALQFAQTGKVMRRSGQVDELSEEQSTLRVHEDSLRRAIDSATHELQRVEGEASAAAMRELTPRHKALAKLYVAKLVELDALVMEEVRLASELQAAGYSPSFAEWLDWPLVGRIDDPHSLIRQRVKELRAYAG
ncbi:MAG: hypothetical protein RIQ60_2613 [Pseudomonadota bacterium]|jgi:hypothetical protein